MSVLRCYSQKKTGFDVEAQGLLGASAAWSLWSF